MKETIKDRFVIFLKHLGIGQGKFEKITGIGNGTINNIKDGISSPKLAKIAETYPELNIEWLITGYGNMLKNISDMPQVSDPQIISLLREQITDLKDTIDRKDREINNLNQEIGRLKGILDENKIQYRQTGT